MYVSHVDSLTSSYRFFCFAFALGSVLLMNNKFFESDRFILHGRNCGRSLGIGLVRVFRIPLKRTNLLLSKAFTGAHSG